MSTDAHGGYPENEVTSPTLGLGKIFHTPKRPPANSNSKPMPAILRTCGFGRWAARIPLKPGICTGAVIWRPAPTWAWVWVQEVGYRSRDGRTGLKFQGSTLALQGFTNQPPKFSGHYPLHATNCPKSCGLRFKAAHRTPRRKLTENTTQTAETGENGPKLEPDTLKVPTSGSGDFWKTPNGIIGLQRLEPLEPWNLAKTASRKRNLESVQSGCADCVRHGGAGSGGQDQALRCKGKERAGLGRG